MAIELPAFYGTFLCSTGIKQYSFVDMSSTGTSPSKISKLIFPTTYGSAIGVLVSSGTTNSTVRKVQTVQFLVAHSNYVLVRDHGLHSVRQCLAHTAAQTPSVDAARLRSTSLFKASQHSCDGHSVAFFAGAGDPGVISCRMNEMIAARTAFQSKAVTLPLAASRCLSSVAQSFV